MKWNGTSLRAERADVIARELYDHEGDMGADFDAFENENLVSDLPIIVQVLSEELRGFIAGQFNSTLL